MFFDTKETTNSPDQLVTPNYPVLKRGGTLLTGTDYKRGSVLGKITASGKYTLVDSTAVDGSEDPVRVLMDDVDATAADKKAPMAITGEFIEDALIFGGTDTIDTHRDAMQAVNLYTKPLIEDAP